MPTESAGPLNMAHQRAANADDYIAQGLLIPAQDEHRKAADAFATCIAQSGDENTKRTLRMLHNEHAKAAKDLERKIAKLREDNVDPTLPQKPTPPRAPAPRSPTLTAGVAANSAPPSSPSPPPSARNWNRMSDSNTVDESFMVLGGRSDPGDAFNQFWKIMEGMMDRLSQPVAFATAPLDFPDPTKAAQPGQSAAASSSSDTDIEDRSSPRRRSGGLGRSLGAKIMGGNMGHSGVTRFPPPRMQAHTVDLKQELDEVLADDNDELSESFCLIPSSEPSQSNPTLLLKTENAALKAELEATRKKLVAQDRMMKLKMEQDRELRDSIVLARREAQRAMATSVMLPRAVPQIGVDFGSLNIGPRPASPVSVPGPVPVSAPPPAGMAWERNGDAQLVRRVRELEEEVRLLKVDNEKQKVMIVRFREKWEKLKENNKKKKSLRAAAEAEARGGSVRERIDEEPEAEAAEMERENGSKDGSGSQE